MIESELVLGCGCEQNIKNEKLEELILTLCNEYGIEEFGVMVRIEGRKRCFCHDKENK